MTLGVGGFVTALEYDGTELQPSSLAHVLWITRGLNDVPLVRGSDDVVPHLVGRLARSRIADVMPIELQGWVLAQGATMDSAVAGFRASVELLKTLFDPELDPRVLSATLEDGSAATIYARVVPPISIIEVVAGHVARVSVALESLDPRWAITS